jgi:hypothetical protein
VSNDVHRFESGDGGIPPGAHRSLCCVTSLTRGPVLRPARRGDRRRLAPGFRAHAGCGRGSRHAARRFHPVARYGLNLDGDDIVPLLVRGIELGNGT